jgi:hypothetical protein
MTNNVINLADHCKKRAEQLERERKALRDAAIAFAMRGDTETAEEVNKDMKAVQAWEAHFKRKHREFTRGDYVDAKRKVEYSLGPPPLEYPPEATITLTEPKE